MKRIYLQNPGQEIAQIRKGSSSLCADPVLIRRAALALASFATDGANGRDVGDPVFDWVTENRRKSNELRRSKGSTEVAYSSCGDLGHWLLMCLGCRNEKIVNRDWDGGQMKWKVGMNISMLVNSPWYTRCKAEIPKPGSIIHVSGAVANTDHIAVFEKAEDGLFCTFNYGQPYARYTKLPYVIRGQNIWFGGRILRGCIDPESITLDESCIVPDDFEGGIVDDNPYSEDLVIPTDVP